MVVDGTRALVVGDYFTVEGELGPWAPLVGALGIDPRSSAMKAFFVAYGAAWIVGAGLWAMGRARRAVPIAFAAGALWYLVVGTVASIVQLALLAGEKEK